jgi:hypothetical protein
MGPRGWARLAVTAVAVGLAVLALGTAGQAAPTVVRARLAVEQTTAPVGTEVGFTLAVTLAGKPLKGVVVVLQVRDEAGAWQSIDDYKTNRKGMVVDTLTGYVPGYVGRYRALVVSPNGAVLARSNQVAVSWTAKGSVGREPS